MLLVSESLFCEARAEWLAAWSGAVHQKLTVFQLVNKFPHFMEPRGSSQQLTHCPYPEPDQSSPCPLSHFSKISFNIIILPTPGSLKWSLSLRFPYQSPLWSSTRHHTCYVPRLSHSSSFDNPNNVWCSVRTITFLFV